MVGKWIKKLNAHLIQFFREYPTQAKGLYDLNAPRAPF